MIWAKIGFVLATLVLYCPVFFGENPVFVLYIRHFLSCNPVFFYANVAGTPVTAAHLKPLRILQVKD